MDETLQSGVPIGKKSPELGRYEVFHRPLATPVPAQAHVEPVAQEGPTLTRRLKLVDVLKFRNGPFISRSPKR